MTPIVVYVVDYGRSFFYMRYTDPETGKEVARTTGEKTRKKAEKVAAKWEADLNEGREPTGTKTAWSEFRERYETEALPGLKDSSRIKSRTVLDKLESFAEPSSTESVTPLILSRFVKSLRDAEKAESTIQGYMATLRAALQWAIDNDLLKRLPKFPKIQRAKRTTSATPLRGRPLTDAEFQKMLDACLNDRWRFYLRGLWLSGLRIEESMDLWWDRTDRLHIVEMNGRLLMSIAAEHEKGHRDRLLPVTPDFAKFLNAVPKSERHGRVFKPYESGAPSKFNVSKRIAEVGERSGVVVNSKSKFASAHDLRRSFGERWSMRVMPQVLMQLMRHSSIETTLRYYVGRNALAVSDLLHELDAAEERDRNREKREKGNTEGNTPSGVPKKKKPQVLIRKRLK